MTDTNEYLGYSPVSPGASIDFFDDGPAGPREVAAAFSRRIKRESAHVRSSFVGASRDSTDAPALARLLRGGRGGGIVKLKVYLSILWVAVSEPYDVEYPARAWAGLIGLPDPAGRGAHRVNAALRRLVEQGFLRSEANPGLPPRLTLLNETGNGQPYLPPGRVLTESKLEGRGATEANRYFKLPTEVWTNGWLSAFSGPGLAMFCVLCDLASGRETSNLWVSPSQATRRFQLSEETRKKGYDELQSLGIVTVRMQRISRDPTQSPYKRNVYELHLERLEDIAPQPSLELSAID